MYLNHQQYWNMLCKNLIWVFSLLEVDSQFFKKTIENQYTYT